MLWQSGWGYILPVWPCPGVSSDGATVSPDPSCLSLQYSCCSSLCVVGLGCYIWSIYPVLSGVLCEFKYALSFSFSFFLSLSEDLSPWTIPQDYLAWWRLAVHVDVLLLQFHMLCLRLWNLDLLTGRATCPRPAVFNSLETAGVVGILWMIDYDKPTDIYSWGADLLHPRQPLWLLFDPAVRLWTFEHLGHVLL